MPNAKELLQAYLKQQAAHGVSHVWLNDEARRGLRPAGRTSPPADVGTTRAAVTRPSRPVTSGAAVLGTAPAHAVDKRGLLERAAAELKNSAAVGELGTLGHIMVPGAGSPDAEIMFVGDAPDARDEQQGEAFAAQSPAGEMLRRIIQAMGLRRSDAYITNLCKYRPKEGQGEWQEGRERPATLAETLVCLPWFNAEIDIVQPKVIVALGPVVAMGLGLAKSGTPVEGHFEEYRNVPVMVTCHPAYLVSLEREPGAGTAEKRLFWEGMMAVMERVGLPVSKKQRAYFSKARG